MPVASNTKIPSKYFRTNDGVRLHYLEAGAGKPLVLIHGLSQTAEQFKFQIEGLADRYRVIALDLRGHGESEKPNFGLKIHRLAEDLREALIAANADDVSLLGHSMGCSVIWAYWELFGADRLGKIVLTDEPPMLTSNPAWTPEEVEAAGSIFTPASLWETANARSGPDGEAAARVFIEHCVSRNCPADVKEWIIRCTLRMAGKDAATLLLNHGCQDWRDIIPRIRLPTLVIGGRVSLIPWKSLAWIAKQIPGAQLEIFEENEGGSHLCSWRTRPSSIRSYQNLSLRSLTRSADAIRHPAPGTSPANRIPRQAHVSHSGSEERKSKSATKHLLPSRRLASPA